MPQSDQIRIYIFPVNLFARYFIYYKSNAIDKEEKQKTLLQVNAANRGARIATSHANTSRMRGYKIFIIIIKQIKKV